MKGDLLGSANLKIIRQREDLETEIFKCPKTKH